MQRYRCDTARRETGPLRRLNAAHAADGADLLQERGNAGRTRARDIRRAQNLHGQRGLRIPATYGGTGNHYFLQRLGGGLASTGVAGTDRLRQDLGGHTDEGHGAQSQDRAGDACSHARESQLDGHVATLDGSRAALNLQARRLYHGSSSPDAKYRR